MITPVILTALVCLWFLARRILSARRRQQLPRFMLTFAVVILVVSMVIFPKEVMSASKTGLYAWWNLVFPALLPFFIGSELLMGFGVVHFMAVLLEPVMRPLFRIPGAGSFVMAIGFTSGYPIGSFLTARLRKEGLCTRREAERLMSFTHNASPLFMLGAVSVNMFHQPQLGLVIAGAHYLANLTIGFFLRFLYNESFTGRTLLITEPNIIRRALQELNRAQVKDGRPFGKLLRDSIQNSVNNLLVIGGFVVIFAVIIKLLEIFHIIPLIAGTFSTILGPLGFSEAVLKALSGGLLELTMGTKMASEAGGPLVYQVMAASFILGWSGLSVIAQVASMVSDTDIRLGTFIITRLLHGFLAAIYSFLFLGPGKPIFEIFTAPAFNQLAEKGSWWDSLAFFTEAFFFVTLLLVVFGILIPVIKNIKLIIIKLNR